MEYTGEKEINKILDNVRRRKNKKLTAFDIRLLKDVQNKPNLNIPPTIHKIKKITLENINYIPDDNIYINGLVDLKKSYFAKTYLVNFVKTYIFEHKPIQKCDPFKIIDNILKCSVTVQMYIMDYIHKNRVSDAINRKQDVLDAIIFNKRLRKITQIDYRINDLIYHEMAEKDGELDDYDFESNEKAFREIKEFEKREKIKIYQLRVVNKNREKVED